eukprot:UN03147
MSKDTIAKGLKFTYSYSWLFLLKPKSRKDVSTTLMIAVSMRKQNNFNTDSIAYSFKDTFVKKK